MELKAFFKTLSRHKLTLIIIPVLSVIITYFLVRNQADNYTSQVQIATGLVDKSQQALKSPDGSDSQIAQDFDNLIEIIRSKKMLDQVAYQLMIHDLTNPKQPFEKPSRLFDQLNRPAKEHALAIYKQFYTNREELSLYNADQDGLHNLIISMKYDNESLLKKMSIYRAESSDFIDIEFSSDDPQLSAFVVNTLAHEFVTYYTFVVKDNQRKAIAFLSNLARAKKDTLDVKNNRLKNYKIQNNILNIDEESKAIYTQITDLQARIQQAQKEVISTQAAIRNIDTHLKPSDKKYVEGVSNRSISNSVSLLNALNNRYAQSNFSDNNLKNKIDSLNNVINTKSQQAENQRAAASTANTTSSAQQGLVSQRLTLQVTYDLAKNSIGSMQANLEALNRRLSAIVPHEAVVQQMESEIDIAQKEYLDILNKSNQASLDANYTSQPKQLELAMPGVALGSKKMLLVALSGIVSFVFCVFVLFLLYFFDNTIKTPEELANKTGAPVLGNLNLLSSSTIDLRKIWTDTDTTPEIQQFKSALQSIRYEVDAELAGNKVLLINSLAEGEGKTFLATNLAYAYSLINKKVLLIDGNFNNPGITKSAKSNLFIEDYLNGVSSDLVDHNSSKITVIGNKNGDGSLLEITKEANIKEKFETLRSVFDIIIIEASALDTLNKSKEWNDYADKILTVFEASKNINESQKANVSYLKNHNNKFVGWVLNVVNKYDSKAEHRAKKG